MAAEAPPRGGTVDRGVVIRLVVIALASRLLVLGVAAVAEVTGAPPAAEPRDAAVFQLRETNTPLLASLTSWDGIYYLDIARHGYSTTPVNGRYVNTVFFPLYPALIRVLHDAGGFDWGLTAVLLSNAAFIGAIGLFGALSMRVRSERWLAGVMLLSLAPGGTAFSMAYADSLFLLLAVAALIAAERGAVRTTALLYLLATLSRPVGIVLGLPLAILLWQRGGGSPAGGARALGWLVLGPLGIVGFTVYQGIAVGDPLAFVHGQAVWSQVMEPASGGAWRPAPEGLATLAGLTVVAVAVAYVVATVVYVVRRRDAYGAYAAVGSAVAFLLGRLASLDRYLAPILPVYWLVARAALPVRVAWAIGSAVVLAALSYLTFQLWLPP